MIILFNVYNKNINSTINLYDKNKGLKIKHFLCVDKLKVKNVICMVMGFKNMKRGKICM